MSDSFTWLSKFGDVCELLDEADRKELIYALAMYGMYGDEPELPFHLKLAFAAMREDVDYSKTRRSAGSKGGRPKAGKKDEKAPSEDAGNVPEKVPEKVPENLCEKVPENVPENPKQSKAEQSKAIQSREGGAKATRFTPPTLEQIAEYVGEKGYGIDPERFFDHYTANGWKVGRNPMKDWKAAVRKWERDDEAKRKEASREEPVFGDW